MMKKMILGFALGLITIGIWGPHDVDALIIKLKSVDCSQLVKGGTNLANYEQAFVCAIALKEVATVCCNKPGCANNEPVSSSHNFELNGIVIRWATSDAKIKERNGTTSVAVTISNEDIIRMVNEFNIDCVNGVLPNGNPCQDADLTTVCPKGLVAFGPAATRMDGLAISLIRPKNGSNDFCPHDPVTGATSCTIKYYPASVDPRWVASCYDAVNKTYSSDPACLQSKNIDLEGDNVIDGQVIEFTPPNDIFKDCRRESSGLQFYADKTPPINGQSLPIDKNASIQDCLVFRDVNNDSNFTLPATYDPDVNHFDYPSNDATTKTFDSPFDGLKDEGGLWLTRNIFAPGTNYTGTCHQHGREQVQNDKLVWKQSGPKKPNYLSPGLPDPTTGDPTCTGGAQIYDGTDYNLDGILP